MKKFNLKPFKRRGKYPFKPEDQNKPVTVFSNQIKTFCPIKPNIVWATDFTYINFQGRFIYLATVIDIYTREILGWHISKSHHQSLVIGALRHALGKTKTRPLYHHQNLKKPRDYYFYERHIIALGKPFSRIVIPNLN